MKNYDVPIHLVSVTDYQQAQFIVAFEQADVTVVKNRYGQADPFTKEKPALVIGVFYNKETGKHTLRPLELKM